MKTRCFDVVAVFVGGDEWVNIPKADRRPAMGSMPNDPFQFSTLYKKRRSLNMGNERVMSAK